MRSKPYRQYSQPLTIVRCMLVIWLGNGGSFALVSRQASRNTVATQIVTPNDLCVWSRIALTESSCDNECSHAVANIASTMRTVAQWKPMVTPSKGGRRVPIGVLSAFTGLAVLIAAPPHGSRAPLSNARWLPRPAAKSWQRHSSCVDGGNRSSSRLAGRPSNNPAPCFSCDYEPDGQQDTMMCAFIPAWSRLQQSRKPRRIAPGLPHRLAQRARGGRLALIPRGRARDSYCVRVLISYAYDLNSRSSALNRSSD